MYILIYIIHKTFWKHINQQKKQAADQNRICLFSLWLFKWMEDEIKLLGTSKKPNEFIKAIDNRQIMKSMIIVCPICINESPENSGYYNLDNYHKALMNDWIFCCWKQI